MDYIELLLGSGVTIVLLVGGYFIRQAVFQKNSEINDEHQQEHIKELMDWKKFQEQNNSLQQKQLDNQSSDISGLRDKVSVIQETFSEFRVEQRRVNEKILDQLTENNKVIAHLDGTLKGLQPIIEKIFKSL